MRYIGAAACLLLGLAAVPAARAETGGFFKNLLSSDGRSANDEAPAGSGPRLYDPNEAYCPPVSIRDGAASVQAGAAGDTMRLRHQITFARLSRACGVRADGALTVKVGVELRALLGPAGAPGTFEVPVTAAVRVLGTIVDSRTRRVRVAVPAGGSQGSATFVEDGLVVPAANAQNYVLEVALAGAPPRAAPKTAARRRPKPAAEASAEGGAPAAGQ